MLIFRGQISSLLSSCIKYIKTIFVSEISEKDLNFRPENTDYSSFHFTGMFIINNVSMWTTKTFQSKTPNADLTLGWP